MKVIILASGSKGNATYIETENAKILLDAGISYRQVKKRLEEKGIEFNSLDAILITHEHEDHIANLAYLLKKTNAELYINKDSYLALSSLKCPAKSTPIKFLQGDTKYEIKDLIFVPIQLSHDAKNIFGFLFKTEDASMAYMTDTGFIPERYFPLLKEIHMLIIESNHDIEMLLDSNRLWTVKQRILSNTGHLSNHLCRDTLKQIISDKTRLVVLAHISSEANTYELAYQENISIVEEYGIKLYIAKQQEASPIFDLKEEL